MPHIIPCAILQKSENIFRVKLRERQVLQLLKIYSWRISVFSNTCVSNFFFYSNMKLKLLVKFRLHRRDERRELTIFKAEKCHFYV